MGKTHAINKVRELFETVLGYELGCDYQLAALQAVMATQIGGDTIHHALGIPAFGKYMVDAERRAEQEVVAKRVLNWRWLIIDEISMVSAKLLAEIDARLRSAVRETGTRKLYDDGSERPFGGLNVIFAGDF